jgi:hypothetical protein
MTLLQTTLRLHLTVACPAENHSPWYYLADVKAAIQAAIDERLILRSRWMRLPESFSAPLTRPRC